MKSAKLSDRGYSLQKPLTSEPFKWRYVRLGSRADGQLFADPALRAKLYADAEAEESSIQAVAVNALAAIYDVDVVWPKRLGHSSLLGCEVLNLRVPRSLDRVIAMHAAARERSVQDEILYALSTHYGLPVPNRRSRTAA